MKKRTFRAGAVLLSAAMLLQGTALLPAAAEEITETCYYADLNGDEVLDVSDLVLMKNGLAHPESLTELGAYAFSNCTFLSAAHLPPHIRVIPAHAFEACNYMTSLTLPDELERIGEYAFAGSVAFERVQIPPHVEIIAGFAFYDAGLTEITFPEGLLSIGRNAFAFCKDLRRVRMPDGLIEIGDNLLRYCDSLEDVRIPQPPELSHSLRRQLLMLIKQATEPVRSMIRLQLLLSYPALIEMAEDWLEPGLPQLIRFGHIRTVEKLVKLPGLVDMQLLDQAIGWAVKAEQPELLAMLLREKKLRGGYDGTGGLLSL